MSTSDAVAGGNGSISDVVARIERLPISWWHIKARIIIGVATFFDAFDALAIAFVLPVLVPTWKLNGPQIGLLISAGYLGQLGGALFFGWIAERYGRIRAMFCSILIFAVMSLACAFAWDYQSLVTARIIQGFGLGGEVPVAAAYISELARAKGRGRFVLLYELVFPVGLVAAGFWARGSCRASAGSGCSSSAHCRLSSPWRCNGCFRNRRVGWRRAGAPPKRRRRWHGSNGRPRSPLVNRCRRRKRSMSPGR